MVTVVLGDYRSIDTFGEQVVIYTAGLITLLVLQRTRTIRRRLEMRRQFDSPIVLLGARCSARTSWYLDGM
jgi:hypothetical protein